MGSIIACICCYCCLSALKPKCIEVIALICNILEIGFLIWGIIKIPCNDIKIGGKIVFFIPCAFVVLTLLILLILMCFRCANKINTSKNGTAKCLCIVMIVFDILSEILVVIAEIIIINNMRDKDGYSYGYGYGYDYYDYNRRNYNNSKYSNGEWAAAVISVSIAEVALMIHCYCANFLLKLINAKTNKSYLDYIETRSQENNITRNVEVFNSPQNQTNTQLNFIGYDQYGHPIYSGNTQYFAQNQNTNNIRNV